MLPVSESRVSSYVLISAVAYSGIMLLVAGLLAYHRIDVFQSGAVSRVNAMTMMTIGSTLLVLEIAILLIKNASTDTSIRITKRKSETTTGAKYNKIKTFTDSGSLLKKQQEVFLHIDGIDTDIPVSVLTDAQAQFFQMKLKKDRNNIFYFINPGVPVEVQNIKYCKVDWNKTAKGPLDVQRRMTTLMPASEGPTNRRALRDDVHMRATENSEYTYLDLEALRKLCKPGEWNNLFGIKPPAARGRQSQPQTDLTLQARMAELEPPAQPMRPPMEGSGGQGTPVAQQQSGIGAANVNGSAQLQVAVATTPAPEEAIAGAPTPPSVITVQAPQPGGDAVVVAAAEVPAQAAASAVGLPAVQALQSPVVQVAVAEAAPLPTGSDPKTVPMAPPPPPELVAAANGVPEAPLLDEPKINWTGFDDSHAPGQPN